MNEYRVGDALDELATLADDSAALVCLDDAWARPKRGDEYHDGGQFGVSYPTHEFETTTKLIDECYRVLEPGGWIIADTDDWLLPKLTQYLIDTWGNAAETYREGYRKTGRVTLTAASGDPDRSTPGMYLSTGGYAVVFAHKGETDRRTSESASQIARRPQERYGWGSVKPLSPYRTWVEALTEPGELVVVPCAGTAPAAIAADQLDRQWLAVDCEPEAKAAFERRQEAEVPDRNQTLTEVTT